MLNGSQGKWENMWVSISGFFIGITSGFESLFYYFVFPYGNFFHIFFKKNQQFSIKLLSG